MGYARDHTASPARDLDVPDERQRAIDLRLDRERARDLSTVAGTAASTLEEAALDHHLELCMTLVGRVEAMCATLIEDTRGLTLEALGV